MRPVGKAQQGSRPAVFDRGSTQSRGMERRPNAKRFGDLPTNGRAVSRDRRSRSVGRHRLGIDAAKSLEGVAQEDEQRFN